MTYQQIDNIGKVSRLGFGAMRFPEKDGKIDQDQVNEMIKVAHDAGVNYYDTAYVYNDGNSEIALGKALKQFPRDSFYLADKLPYARLQTMEDRDTFFQESLDRCGVEYFDFYLMHATNADRFPLFEKFDLVNWALEKKKQGKIKNIGFSIHDTADLLRRQLDLCQWDFVQIQYNYMDTVHEPGGEGYRELVKRNIPIVIMEPLKGGLLANLDDKIAQPFRVLGGSNVGYAFRWLTEQKGIMVILSGMSTLEQTADNCKVFSDLQPLTQEEHQAILQVEVNIKALQKVSCTGCAYCMPCPMEINIPGSFSAWNKASMYGGQPKIDFDTVKKCITCGKCATQCPQKIDIPGKLKVMLSEYVK